MAGYMTKMYGNLYEGEFKNGAAAPVKNGVLMVLDPTTMTLKLPSADSTSSFLCKEALNIFDGVPAYRFIVESLAERYYFVENAAVVNEYIPYDTVEFEAPVGAYMRAHPLEVNDEFVATTAATIAAGSSYGVLATGLIG